MAGDVTELVIKLISGGVVGYSANLLAVKMLFKKIPGSSSITNNYQVIENSLGELTEKKLQQNNSLGEELKKEKFTVNLENFVNHLNKETIPENIPAKNISEVPGINQTINNLNEVLLKNKEQLTEINPEALFNLIELKNLISSEQLNAFSNKILDIFNIVAGAELKGFLAGIYQELKDKNITEFVSVEILNKLANNSERIIDDLPIRMTEADEEIGAGINRFLELIDLNTILSSLEENIKKKTLLEIIGTENTERLTTELINHFVTFINTDEGKIFLTELSGSLVMLAREIDRPLLNFLNPSLQVKMFVFLEKNIPYLAETAKEWLRINKQGIEQLIESSIDEYYSTQKMWGQIKLSIKDILGLKISEYFSIVEKGIERFESYISNNATKDLTEEVVKFLENKKLGTLISELKLEPEKLSRFFHLMINDYLPKLNQSIFRSLFDKQLGDIAGLFKLDLREQFSDKINEFLVKQIKYQFFYNSAFPDSIREIIKTKMAAINEIKVSDILSPEKFDEYIGYLPILLMFSRGKMVDKVVGAIDSQLAGKKAGMILNDEIKALINSELVSSFENKIPDLTPLLKDIPLHKISDTDITEIPPSGQLNNLSVQNQENTKNNPDKNIHFKGLEKTINPLISKKVIKGIKESFNKLSVEQINNSSSQLLGDGTTTATLTGTLIGALTGTALYFVQSSLNTGIDYLTPLIYGTLGIGTNWLALKMLFAKLAQPEESGKTGGKKTIFSASISQMAGQAFKSPDISKKVFSDNIQAEIKTDFSENNFAKLNNLMLENSELITDKFLPEFANLSLDALTSDSLELSGSFADKAADFELNKIPEAVFEKYFITAIGKSEKLLNRFLINKAGSYQEQTLKSLPAKLITSLNELAASRLNNKIAEMIPLIKESTLEEKAINSLQQLDSIINFDIKLQVFMSFGESINFKEKTISYLERQIRDKVHEGIEKFIQHSFMEDELAPDKEIRSLFNGELVFFVKRHMFKALDSLIFGMGLEKLKDEKENITNKIINELRESNKDNFLYGLGESILNLDVDIREIIHLIIDTKLEPYLKDKKWELENILTGYVEFISRKKLSEIDFSEEMLNSENIAQVIEKFLSNKNILNGIHFLSAALLEDISKYELGFMLDLIGIQSLKDIPGKFNQEISLLKEDLFNNLSSNKEKIEVMSTEFLATLLDKVVYSMPFSKILEGISDSEVAQSVEQIVSTIFSSGTFKTYQKLFSANIYLNLSEKKAGDLIDAEILKKSLSETFDLLGKDQAFRDELINLFRPFCLNIVEQAGLILVPETKDFIIEILSQSLSESFSKSYGGLLESLDINALVEKEINNFSPEEHEQLFAVVSKPALSQLALAGLAGAVIGILTEFY